MFTALQFKERMNQTPFKPFRIHMSDGSSYDVTNHDMAFVKRHAIEVGIDLDRNSIILRSVECAILHISRVEDIATANAA
jgi:hypothetical protein